MGIETALTTLAIADVNRSVSLPGANGADETEAGRPAQHLTFQPQALFAVGVNKQLRGALAVGGLHILVPQIERLQHMSIRVNDTIAASHGGFPLF